MISTYFQRYLPILLILVIFCSVYAFTFDQKLNLGGDNLAYYYLGKSLSMGLGYSNITSPEITPHTHFPPGYPVIISGLLRFIEEVTAVKLLNGVFGLGVVLVGFLLFKDILRSQWLAFLIIVFVVLNGHFIEYSFIMMSEIPFLFFLMLAVYLMTNLSFNKSWYKNFDFLILILIVGLAFYIRSFGVVLILGLLFELLAHRRYPYLISFSIGVSLLILPWWVRNHTLSDGGGYLSQVMMINPYDARMGLIDFDSLISRIASNGLRYLDKEVIYLVFNSSAMDYARELELFSVALSLMLLALLIYGILHLRAHRFFFLGLFLGGGGVLLLWPSEWYGTRFLLPLLPLLVGLCFYGFCVLLEKSSNRIISVALPYLLIAILIVSQLPYIIFLNGIKSKDYPEIFKDYFSASEWIKENSDPTDIVMCRKPLLSYHFSLRPSMQWSNSWEPEEVIEGLNANDVDYVIMDMLGYSSTREKILPLFELYPEKFEPVQSFGVTSTFIAKYTSYLGYNGDLVDGKKDGRGVYISKDGTIYRGEWKNDLRHGIGALRKPGLEEEVFGIWLQDTLVRVIEIPDGI